MRKSLTTRLEKKYGKPKGLENSSLVLAYVRVRNRNNKISYRRNWVREPDDILRLYKFGYDVLDWGIVKEGGHFSRKTRSHRSGGFYDYI